MCSFRDLSKLIEEDYFKYIASYSKKNQTPHAPKDFYLSYP